MAHNHVHLTKESIFEALKTVKAPGARGNLIELDQIAGMDVQAHSAVIAVTLSELNPLVEKSLSYQIEKAVQSISAEASVRVEFVKPEGEKVANKIGTLIAVGSGKGGVGKSAVTVNLAFAFKRMGYSVGILDCDIYGPSVPTMLGVAESKPLMLNGKIQPVEAFGLKIMSAGFFIEPGQSLVWRGPMIHKLIQQFVNDVDWNHLDILMVDLPPGTGDAPLSLSQTIPLTGAVMVSMPQKISLIDVHKGISMFNQVKVPILGVIENMSSFVCPSCDHIEEIFDHGGVRKFCEQMGLGYLGEIPIDPKIRRSSDNGTPYLEEFPDAPASKAILGIAQRLQPFLRSADDADGDQIKIVV